MGFNEDSSMSPPDGAQTTPILKPTNSRVESSNDVSDSSVASNPSDTIISSLDKNLQSDLNNIDHTHNSDDNNNIEEPRTPVLQTGMSANGNDDDEGDDILEKIPALPLSPPKHILRRLTPIGQFSPKGSSNYSLSSSNSGNFLQSFDEHEQRKLKLLNEKISKLESYTRSVDDKVNNLKLLRSLHKEYGAAKLQKKLEHAQKLRDDYIERKRKIACSTVSNIMSPLPHASISSNTTSTSSVASKNESVNSNNPGDTFTERKVSSDDLLLKSRTETSNSTIPSDEDIAGIIQLFFKFPQFTRQTTYSRRIKYEKVVNFVSSKVIVDSLVRVFKYFDILKVDGLNNPNSNQQANKSKISHEVYIRSFLYGFLTISENYQYQKNQTKPSYDTRLDSNTFNYNDLIPNIHKTYLDDSFNNYLVERYIEQSVNSWNSFANFINSIKENSWAYESSGQSENNENKSLSSSSIVVSLKSSSALDHLTEFSNNFNTNYLPLFQVFKNHHKQRSLLLLKRSIYNLQRHGFFIDVSKRTETNEHLLNEYTEIGSLIQNQLNKLQEQYDNLKKTNGGPSSSNKSSDLGEGISELDFGSDSNSSLLNFDFINDEFPDDFNYHYLNNELCISHHILNDLEKSLVIDHNNQLLSSTLATDNPLALNKSAASISVASPLAPQDDKHVPMAKAVTSALSKHAPNDLSAISTDENASNIFSGTFNDDHGHPTDMKKNMVLVPPQFTVNQWREHLIKVVLDYRSMVSNQSSSRKEMSSNFVSLKTGRSLMSSGQKGKLSPESSPNPSFLEYIEYQWTPNVEAIRRYLSLKTYVQGYDEAVEKLSALEDSDNFINMMGDISSMVFRAFHALYIVIRNKNGKISIVLPTFDNSRVNIYDSFRMKHKNDISQIVDLVFLMKRFKNEDFSMFEYFNLVLTILVEEVPSFLKDESKSLLDLLNGFELQYDEARDPRNENAQTQGGFVWLSDTGTTLGNNKLKYAAIDKIITKDFVQRFIEFIKDSVVFGLNNWVFNCTRMAAIYKHGNGIIHLERRLFNNCHDSVAHADIIENKFSNTFELIRSYKHVVVPKRVNNSSDKNETSFNGFFYDDLSSSFDKDLSDKFGIVKDINALSVDESSVSSIDCYDYFNNLFIEYIFSGSMTHDTSPEQFESFTIQLSSLLKCFEALASTQAIAIILMSDISRHVGKLPVTITKAQPAKFVNFTELLKTLFEYLYIHSDCKTLGGDQVGLDMNDEFSSGNRCSKVYKKEILEIFVQNCRKYLLQNNIDASTIEAIVLYIFDEKKVFNLIEKAQVLNIDGENKSLKSLFTGYLKSLVKVSKFSHALIPSLSTEYEIGDEKYYAFDKGSTDSSEDDYISYSSFIKNSSQLTENYSKISELQGKFFKDHFIQTQLNRIVMKYYNLFNLCFEIHWLDFMAIYRRWLNLLADEYSE